MKQIERLECAVLLRFWVWGLNFNVPFSFILPEAIELADEI